MYRLYMGSQILTVLLGRHESVGLRALYSVEWPKLPIEPLFTDRFLFDHRQPILADEVQTFKALITVHKVLQEGHPIAVKEAQANINWLESLTRGVAGDGIRGTTPKGAEESPGLHSQA